MNPRRLFVASCLALVASAFSFVIRQDVLPAWGETFRLSAQQLGMITGLAFWGMASAMALGAFVVDALGMKAILGLAFLCQLSGTLLTILTPYLAGAAPAAFPLLCVANFLVGAGNGLIEIAVNPLAATLYPTEKTHRLNVLHAWWPGGLILGGLATVAITKALGQGPVGGAGSAAAAAAVLFGWQVKIGLVLVPTVIYGILFLTQRFPVTERVASGVSTGAMLAQAARPAFLLWAFCMLLTAATELAPQGMQSLVLERTAGMNGTYILIYTSLIAFTLRHFAGPLARILSPIGMLTASAALSAVGLYALSFAFDKATALVAATVYGLGIAYFWPTMLGVTAERFPRGGAFVLGLMGCVGDLAIGVVSPIMGGINDRTTLETLPVGLRNQVVVSRVIDPARVEALPPAERAEVARARSEGAKWSFRYVAVLPVALIFIFGAIALTDRARGGYRPERLESDPPPGPDPGPPEVPHHDR